MPNAIKQTVKKDLASSEKWKEFGLVAGAIALFYLVYFLSGLIGYLSIIGYLGAAAIVYCLYRMICRYSERFLYQIENGTLSIMRGQGRRCNEPLAEFCLSDIIAVFPNSEISLPNAEQSIFAAKSANHPENIRILVRLDGVLSLITITPNATVKAVVLRSVQKS